MFEPFYACGKDMGTEEPAGEPVRMWESYRLEARPSKAGLGPVPRATRFTGGGGLFFRKICLVG